MELTNVCNFYSIQAIACFSYDMVSLHLFSKTGKDFLVQYLDVAYLCGDYDIFYTWFLVIVICFQLHVVGKEKCCWILWMVMACF